LGYWGVRPHDMLPQVGQLAEQALSLDPHCAEAHMSLAIYLEWYEYRWREAAAAFEHAVELNPSSSSIRLYYAIHLVAVGRWDDANSHRELACQLDPSSMVVRGNASWILYLQRPTEKAIAEGRMLRAIDPSSAYGAFSHGLVCTAPGADASEAIAAFRDAVALSGGASLYRVMLAFALAVGGEHAAARELLESLER